MNDQAFLDGGRFAGPFGGSAGGAGGSLRDRDAMADGIARWVVRLVAARRTAAAAVPQPDLVARLRQAVCSDRPGDLHGLLRLALREKIGAAEMADLYVPAVARDLGADWLDDRLSFAEVHAACARLQSLLRFAGQAWMADAARPGLGGGSVLLLVAPGETHTLGAMVLLGQLRRLGISVRLSLWPGRDEIAALAAAARPDAVMVSTADARDLAPARKFVNEIRAALVQDRPVLLGGAAALAGTDLRWGTGADLATADLSEALRFCGLAGAGAAGFAGRVEGVT
jgi:hypothetical protein